jgi:arginyl-tRNA synthetase
MFLHLLFLNMSVYTFPLLQPPLTRVLCVLQFPETVEDMLDELMPNRLTEYLYTLSEAFNGFYTECKVLGSEQEDGRLLLVEATARIMRQCFGLLGITPLYRI